jgi:hypothetical protein
MTMEEDDTSGKIVLIFNLNSAMESMICRIDAIPESSNQIMGGRRKKSNKNI